MKKTVTEKKEFSAQEWKKKYYSIPANHSSLNKETRESLLKAVDHSITKWKGLATIKDIDVSVIPPFTAVEELIELKIDSDSCALCMRTGTNCSRCPLYYAQGNYSCGEYRIGLEAEEPYGKAFDAENLSSFIKAAKAMVKNLKKARKIAENPKFPYSQVLSEKEHDYLDRLFQIHSYIIYRHFWKKLSVYSIQNVDVVEEGSGMFREEKEKTPVDIL